MQKLKHRFRHATARWHTNVETVDCCRCRHMLIKYNFVCTLLFWISARKVTMADEVALAQKAAGEKHADTIFGKIVRGEIPCKFIYEDEQVRSRH